MSGHVHRPRVRAGLVNAGEQEVVAEGSIKVRRGAATQVEHKRRCRCVRDVLDRGFMVQFYRFVSLSF